MITFTFIRHAESMGNVNHHLIGGQSNHLPLSPRGEEQARSLGQRLAREGTRFDEFHCSTAVRAQATAGFLCEALAYDPARLRTWAHLLELSQGEWEGQDRATIYTPELKAKIHVEPYHFCPPGGESQAMVETRMYQWLEARIAEVPAGENRHFGAVSHGMAIKTLIRKLMDADPLMTYRTVIHNTSLTVVQLINQNWYVERVNDHAHLAGTEMIGHY